MKILDKSKPYGTICGGRSRAVYDQDGVLFDSMGFEIDPPDQEPEPQPEVPKEPEPVPEPEIKSDEETVLDLKNEGRTLSEIRKITKMHHKTIERIVKNAEVGTEGGLD